MTSPHEQALGDCGIENLPSNRKNQAQGCAVIWVVRGEGREKDKRHTVEDEGGWINPNINSIYTKASICIGSI